MSEKIYLHLLILCGILCQQIIASLLDDNTKGSSDFLVRNKRVINLLPGGLIPTPIEQVNYIVNIKLGNRAHCVGVILSPHTVITAAPCVTGHDISQYQILSGSGHTHRSTVHNITSKSVNYGNPPNNYLDSIALITADPPFVYKRRTGNIQLYTGILPEGTHATVSGWGCSYPTQPGPNVERRLRTISLSIMNHRECQNIYRGLFDVSEKHICTYHAQQYCARTDAGAPLVVNNKLAGIHIYKGEYFNQRNPDVFINLLRPDYSEWIREYLLLHLN